MDTKRTHVVIPEELVQAIDRIVGSRGRSRFIAEVAAREVKRLEQLQGLGRAVGSWKDEDHPELKDGSAKWVEKLRDEAEGRLCRARNR